MPSCRVLFGHDFTFLSSLEFVKDLNDLRIAKINTQPEHTKNPRKGSCV